MKWERIRVERVRSVEVRREEAERRRIIRVRRWRRGMFRSFVWVASRIGRRVRRVVEIVWVTGGSYVSGCLVYIGREGKVTIWTLLSGFEEDCVEDYCAKGYEGCSGKAYKRHI